MVEKDRITIRDVMRASGHALSTVSNALSDSPLVKAETKARIRQIAQELGYRPSRPARALRTQRSFTIGVLVPDIANPAQPEFVKGIERVAQDEGASIFLCNTDEDEEKQIRQMESLIDHGVDGMILISQHVESDRLRALLEHSHPYVLLQRRSQKFRDDYVGSDNIQGTQDTVEYLLALGHRRIGFVTGPKTSSTAMERLDAFIAIKTSRGLDSDSNLIFWGDYTEDAGRRAFNHFAKLPERPSAIIASNDLCAIGILDAATQNGEKIPESFSLVGCDNIRVAGLSQIDITTLELPKFEMGQAAARLLYARIKSQEVFAAQEIIMPTRLVVRGSCAPIASD